VTITRTLRLLRHAKSAWDDASLGDFARPLAPRGERGGEAIRRHLAANSVAVELVLCSTATRARQTWDAVCAGVTGAPEVRFTDEIYGAPADRLLALLRESGGAASVLLIGHNPGIADLATGLVANPGSSAAERMYDKYPTAALATFTVDAPWERLSYGGATLTSFVRPRDLPPA